LELIDDTDSEDSLNNVLPQGTPVLDIPCQICEQNRIAQIDGTLWRGAAALVELANRARCPICEQERSRLLKESKDRKFFFKIPPFFPLSFWH